MSDRTKIEEGETYSSADVARIVFHKEGRNIEWFYANKDRLMAKEGFPKPISRFGWPKWNGADLLAWLGRDKSLSARAASGRNVVDFSEVLRQRTRQLASGH